MSRHALARAVLRHLIDDFEHNPHVQFRFHLVAMYFWMANAVVAVAVFFLFPDQWAAVGIFWTLLLSLYANWDTDYDAMSASGAWMEAKSLHEDGTP